MTGRAGSAVDVDALRALFIGPAYHANAESRLGAGDYDFDHFVEVGLALDISPTFYFDPTFYASQRPARPDRAALLDFLDHGAELGVRPHPLVDPPFVVSSGVVALAKLDISLTASMSSMATMAK